MSSTGVTTGGCLCGAIRYEATDTPLVAGYCHCRLCQRSTGSPYIAGVIFPKARVRLTRGAPKTVHSSPRGVRHFCGNCGSQIFFEPLDKPDRMEVILGSLDDPSAYPPAQHIWWSSRQKWIVVTDDLPKFEHGRPPGFNERPAGG